MTPQCKLAKRGVVRANDLLLSNDLEAWPDSSVGRALDVQSQGSRGRIPLGSVIFSHFHFSLIRNEACGRELEQGALIMADCSLKFSE